MSMDLIEDIYSLSPLQQGMLLSGSGYRQRVFELHGSLNIPAFIRAWQKVIQRHTILRTGFVLEDPESCVQVVYSQVELPVEVFDWKHLSTAEQEQSLKDYMKADKKRSFVLSEPPLMRMAIFEIAKDIHKVFSSDIHVLLDGWSRNLIMVELFDFYDAFSNNYDLEKPSPKPYRDYIHWLQQQDDSQAEAFWRKSLSGITEPTAFISTKNVDFSSDASVNNFEQFFKFSDTKTASLQALAKQYHLTLNTFVQAMWALLLSRYSADTDVVYGMLVAGRPIDIVDIESMIGYFVNILPTRVTVSPHSTVVAWLKKLQDFLAELRQYEYCANAQIQSWSDMVRGKPLFQSVVAFQNFPADAAPQKRNNIETRNANLTLYTEGNIALMIFPSSELVLKIICDKTRFDTEVVNQMLNDVVKLLEMLPNYIEKNVSELLSALESKRLKLLVNCPSSWRSIGEPLNFWLSQLGIPFKVQTLPSATIERILESPATLSNIGGVNVFLFSFDNWVSGLSSDLENYNAKVNSLVKFFKSLLSPSIVCFLPLSSKLISDSRAVEAFKSLCTSLSSQLETIPGVQQINFLALLDNFLASDGKALMAIEKNPNISAALATAIVEKIPNISSRFPFWKEETTLILSKRISEFKTPAEIVEAIAIEKSSKQVPKVLPRTPMEKMVASLLSDLLSSDEIGIYDDFFALGMTSIQLNIVLIRLEENFHVDLPHNILFSSPNVDSLVTSILYKLASKAQCIDEVFDAIENLSDTDAEKLITPVGN